MTAKDSSALKNATDGRKGSFEDKVSAITRIWLTTFGSINTILRFYFDGKDEPGWEVPSYDLQKFGVRGLKKGLIEPDNKWNRGSLIYLPVPYNNGCKVTMEELTPNGLTDTFCSITANTPQVLW